MNAILINDDWKEELINCFYEEWLSSQNNHPLQILWNRIDDVAKLELCTLSKSLSRLRGNGTDNNSLNSKINDIKQADSNNQQGVFFEILSAASIINNQGESARLYSAGYEVLDCFLPVDTTRKMHFSMKSFQRSNRQKRFIEQAEIVANKIPEMMKENKTNASIFLIECNEYPNNDDFSFVIDLINESLARQNDTVSFLENGCARITKFPLQEETISCLQSYAFNLYCPFHRNEIKNVTDYMDKANSDFKRISNRSDADVYGLCMHLNPHTNLDEIEAHFHLWDADNDSSVDFIILGCYFLDWDFSNNHRQLTYSVKMFGNKRFSEWRSSVPENYFSFNLPAAKLAETFPNHIGYSILEQKKIAIKNSYIYSKGRIYMPVDKLNSQIQLIANNTIRIPVIVDENKAVWPKDYIGPYSYDDLLIL